MTRRLLQNLLRLALVFTHLAVSMALAKEPPRFGAVEYQVTRWTTEDGLPQNRVACLKQTRNGYLWIGTWFGLARFDGLRFTVFNKANTPELAGDAITALAEDTEGTLWIGTSEGLVAYHDHRFRRWTTKDGLPDENKVWRIAASHFGGIWIQSGTSVSRFLAGKFIFERKLDLSIEARVLSLQEAADGWLDMLAASFAPREWLKLSSNGLELRTNYVTRTGNVDWLAALPARQQGGAWIGTTNGVMYLRDGWLEVVGPGERRPQSPDFIYEDRSGKLWVDERTGDLSRWDGARWRAISLGDQTGPVNAVCMEEDREGGFWIGTLQGLIHLQARIARSYTTRDGLPDDEVWSVCEGLDGTVWVGTRHGLGYIRSGVARSADAIEPPSILQSEESCVWPDLNGGVWLGKAGFGLATFRDGKFSSRQKATIAIPNIHAIYEAPTGVVWVGSDQGVSVVRYDANLQDYVTTKGPAPGDVHCIVRDREGTLWFGTKGKGLARFQNDKMIIFTKLDGLSDDQVWAICEDRDGSLWLATENGLTRYKNGRFFAFERRHGMRESVVNCVLEDDFGFLWLSGIKGVCRVRRAQLDAVAEGRAKSAAFAVFGTADGMATDETNGGNQPSGWKARDGKLWFATMRGAVCFDPRNTPHNEEPVPVEIERVKADDQVVFGDPLDSDGKRIPAMWDKDAKPPMLAESAVLPAGGARVVEFHYTANTFIDPKRVRFRYRLEGLDKDFGEETSQRGVSYLNLPPNRYRLEVIAAGHNGVWSSTPVRFAFSIAPHFWQVWPFYFLCGSAAIALAGLVLTYRLRWQRRLLEVEHQRALASERARIARDLHDDLGTALTGHALQLDVLRHEAQVLPLVSERLAQSAGGMRDLAERMREVIWSANPRCDTVSSLASFLEQQASQFLGTAGLHVRIDFPENIPALPLDGMARHQLALGVREALSNIVRHARATEAILSLAIEDGSIIVGVADNGQGFNVEKAVNEGHGLANLRERFEQMGGRFECASAPGAGAKIQFRLAVAGRSGQGGDENEH